jgi:hypothetical protein
MGHSNTNEPPLTRVKSVTASLDKTVHGVALKGVGPHGYEHPAYAASFSEFGSPVFLHRSGGWVIKREIPDSSHNDLMGPYPLFFCQDWGGLSDDLAELAGEAVTFSMVADPFAKLPSDFFKTNFDIAIPYKDHFIAELSRPPEAIGSKSHLENARRALRKVEVSRCLDPPGRLEEWIVLFEHLAKRYRIQGIRAFSKQAFSQQLRIPGMVMFEAREIATGELVGMDLWYLQNKVAYGHLAAFNERGYALRASYATKWQVIKYFSDKAGYLHFGASAGMGGDGAGAMGLTHFKKGWSTGTIKSYFCGKILNRHAYAGLVRDNETENSPFFPAYRMGTF